MSKPASPFKLADVTLRADSGFHMRRLAGSTYTVTLQRYHHGYEVRDDGPHTAAKLFQDYEGLEAEAYAQALLQARWDRERQQGLFHPLIPLDVR
jgi:hypothetical protein